MIDGGAQRPGGGTRILGLDDGPDYRDPACAGLHDLGHPVRGDAADGDHRARRDSDADGVSDSDEIDFYGTDALDPDTDGDGLDDAEELLTYGTNPLLDDTDGDAVSDGDEVDAGSDPLDAVSVPATPTPLPTATPPATPEPMPSTR